MYKEVKDNEKKGVFYFDRVEVGGSTPSTPTRLPKKLGSFSFFVYELFMNFWSKFRCRCIRNAIAFVDIL